MLFKGNRNMGRVDGLRPSSFFNDKMLAYPCAKLKRGLKSRFPTPF
jgi:hypothetical protein